MSAVELHGAVDLAVGEEERVSRTVVRVAIFGTLLLAAGSFWLSFHALRELAIMSGIVENNAWVWPIIVDGVILEATVSVVALAEARREARRFAWLLLIAGALVSVGANVIHALIISDARVPALIAACVSSVPPLVLVSSTHLTVHLSRNSRPADAGSARPTRSPSATSPGRETVRIPANQALAAATVGERRRPALAAGESRAAGSRPRHSRDVKLQARRMAAEDPPPSHRQIGAALGVHPTTISRWLAAPDEHTGRSTP